MGLFGVSDQAMLKAASSATETSKKIEILLEESSDMVFSKKRITKALISLHGCAGCSAPLFFANPEDRLSHVEAQYYRYYTFQYAYKNGADFLTKMPIIYIHVEKVCSILLNNIKIQVFVDS